MQKLIHEKDLARNKHKGGRMILNEEKEGNVVTEKMKNEKHN